MPDINQPIAGGDCKPAKWLFDGFQYAGGNYQDIHIKFMDKNDRLKFSAVD